MSDGLSMEEVVKQFKPSVLLGLAAQPAGLFTQGMIESMGSYCARPIVMPMSNPTAKAECTPAQAYEWSDGKAIVATGSPFPPYKHRDGKTLIPSQCNNMYVFPGLGLAASVAGVSEITDAMLYKVQPSVARTSVARGRPSRYSCAVSLTHSYMLYKVLPIVRL